VRKRIVLATCGAVLAALVLAGLGTLALARLDARASTRSELEQQSRALAAVFEAIGEPLQGGTGRLQAPLVRQRLRQLAQGLDLEDMGFLVSGPALDYRGELPDGITLSPQQLDALRAGDTVSGTHDRTEYAAAPGTHTRVTADGSTAVVDGFVIVLTAHPASAASPAGRWFVLAAAGTLALAVVVAIVLSRRLARPITAARDAAHRIASGDLAVRVPEPPPGASDELADLSRSINTMAEALERSRGLDRQFLMSVSHDLRTPMASIQGYAEALTDGAIEPDRAGAVILTESKRLDRLVTDLLLLSRLDARSFTFDLHPTPVGPVVAATAAGFLPRATEQGVALDLHGPTETLAAHVDPDRLGQVVANLVENALKFARTRIAIRVLRDGDWVVVSVADDGPGIAVEDLSHVFERLYVAAHRPTPKESGSGLGLAIVKELVEAMGGRVSVRSPAAGAAGDAGGPGTEFAIALRPALPRSGE
jgi:two-component system sensor histidine kinase BaeS